MSSEISADDIHKFSGKMVKLLENVFSDSDIFLNRGKSEIGENASLAYGGWTPL